MIELLSTFSGMEIILFLVLAAVAFKKIADFLDWMKEKISKRDKKHQDELSEEQKNEQRLDNLETDIKHITESINIISSKINTLMESDKDDIKAFITREHHYFCYTKGWIDDFSMDCIEKRYNHYVEEDGNSFVLDLMKQLRALPKQEPKNNKGAE